MLPDTTLGDTPSRHELQGLVEVFILKPSQSSSNAIRVLAFSQGQDRIDRLAPFGLKDKETSDMRRDSRGTEPLHTVEVDKSLRPDPGEVGIDLLSGSLRLYTAAMWSAVEPSFILRIDTPECNGEMITLEHA